MFNKFLTLATLALLALATSVSADPGIPDTVRTPDAQVNPGDHFSYPVFIFNDEDLSGGTLGFNWGTADLQLDSISFAGGVLGAKPAGQLFTTIDNVNHEALTGFFTIFDPPVPPGTGTWATFWFTADPAAPDQVIPFDSTKVGPSGDFVIIALQGNESIKPQYAQGSITIGNPQSNTPPTIEPVADQTVAEGSSLSVNVQSTDAESIPSLSNSPLPTFMNFTDNGDGSGALAVNPGFEDAGIYPVVVFATDGEFTDSVAFTVTVENTNRAPVWTVIPPQTVNEGDSLSVALNATDPDNDSLTMSLLSSPANSFLIDNGAGSGFFTFAPDFTQSGVHVAILAVTDGNLSDTIPIQVTVMDVNRPPAWTPAPDVSVAVGDTLMMTLTADDPDLSDQLTLSVDGALPANATFTDNQDRTGKFTFVPDLSQAGMMYTIIMLASDGVATAADTFKVTVEQVIVPDSAFITPDTLFFTQEENSGAVDTGCFLLTSTNAPAAYQVTVADNFHGKRDTAHIFVNLLNTSGTTDESVCVTVSSVGRNPGRYYNTIFATVTGVDNNPVRSVVCMTVVEAPPTADSAFVIPDTLFFTATQGDGLTAPQCAAINSTIFPIVFHIDTVTGDPLFTDASIDGVPDSARLCLSADPGTLEPGTYYNQVFVIVDSVVNNPLTLVSCLTVEAPDTALTVLLDIKPGSCPNSVNAKEKNEHNKAVVPVAIIGSADFDVHDIDLSSILLAGVAPVRSNFSDVANFDSLMANKCDCARYDDDDDDGGGDGIGLSDHEDDDEGEDEGGEDHESDDDEHENMGDGIKDLSLKFYRSELVVALGDISELETIELTLTGSLKDGRTFSASDCIRLVPKQHDRDKSGVSMSELDLNGSPGVFTLVGNYPNPFNPSTSIVYGLPNASFVTVDVYNVAGQKVATLVNGERSAGYHTVTWDASNVASGVYFYRMEAEGTTVTKKMIMLK